MSVKRAAVIGSGFGGLALAIRLQSAGFKTVIFEKRDMPGGRAYVYRENGFVFDAGPTLITAPECLEELFAVAGASLSDYVQLVPLRPFYRLCWDDGYTLDYSGDEAQVNAQIRQLSPADVEGFRRFMDYSQEVYREGYVKLAAAPFLHWRSMLQASPQLLRLQAFRTVYAMVSRFIRDQHLRQAFSFHPLLIGGNPFSASSIYTLVNFLEKSGGVWFAMGGTGALVQGLAKLFKDIGGELRLDAEVERITTHNRKVTGLVTQRGEIENFDLVASNADVLHTYQHLLKDEPLAEPSRARFSRMRQSMSLFLIYFGTTQKYPDIGHHTIIFGPRYRDLLNDIFERGLLADDFSLYLHKPTHTDPSLAPPGCETFYVLSPVPHLGISRINWHEEAHRYADRILDYLESKYLPGLRQHLAVRRLFTPENFRDDLNSPTGSAFSFEPILRQSAYFRAHNRDASIGGLYLAGAGTHPGAGIPGVINSAKATSQIIRDDVAAGRI
jgi:phytoene desaturase